MGLLLMVVVAMVLLIEAAMIMVRRLLLVLPVARIGIRTGRTGISEEGGGGLGAEIEMKWDGMGWERLCGEVVLLCFLVFGFVKVGGWRNTLGPCFHLIAL
jgi:hypothetical protein